MLAPACVLRTGNRDILESMSLLTAIVRTASQFLYVLGVVIAVPCLMVLIWGLSGTSRFLASAPLGLTLGEYAAVAAVSTVTANAIAFLRPDDMADWMLPFAAALLVVFAGLVFALSWLPR